MAKIGLCLLALVLAACTTRNWYEGMRQGAINDCEKLRDITERNRCIEAQPDYQQYQQQRQQLNKQP